MEKAEDFLQAFPILAECMPDGCLVYRADDTREILRFNAEAMRIFGCETTEEFRKLTGNTFKGIVHPEDYKRIEHELAAQRRATAGSIGQRSCVEYRIVRRDGAVRMVSDYGKCLKSASGEELYVAFLEDKTDTVARSLNCFEHNFVKILKVNLTQDSYTVLKTDAEKKDRAGKSFVRWLRDFGESDNVHPDDIDSYFAYTNHYYLREYFLRYEKPWRLRYRRRAANGYAWVMMEMLRAQEYAPDNQVIMLYVQAVDDDFNSLYGKAQKADADWRFFAAATSVLFPLGIVINVTRNQYHVVRSKNFLRRKAPDAGTLDELITIAASSVPTPEGQLKFQKKLNRQALLEAFFQGERERSLRHQQVADDGSIHWVESKIIFVDGPDEDVRAVCVASYIDDEMVSLENLKQAQRDADRANRAKEAFLFNMSHDIRTPLNAILGLAELTERHVNNPKQILHYMSELKDSGELLLSIMKNILEYARIAGDGAELDEAPCNIMETMGGLKPFIDEMIADKRLNLTVELDVTNPMIYCDRSKLKVITLNLLSNAIKYTPQGGNIKVKVKQYIDADKQNCLVELCFEDDGIGMTQSFQRHIFEPFTRAATSTVSGVQGTGLGMSLVKNMVDVMGGNIEIESSPGAGTKVTLTLSHRLVTDEELKTQNNVRPDTEALKGKRLLLAEDNDINAEITIGLLNEVGIEADRAVDGVECVAMLKNAAPDYYQMVLMDIQMPNLDGLGAAEVIRRLDLPCSKIPIVALTANAFAEDKEKTLRAGMNAHLSKPIDVRELFTVLLQYLG